MELKVSPAEDYEAYCQSALRAFHRVPTAEELERYRKIDEPDRALAWYDDDGAIVATTAAFSRRLTVPGGAQVECAAVTSVTVLPTHRRRGLLTGMMERQLADVRERGEPVAALWASEGGIYGRFGFGVAAQVASLTARRPAARLAAPPAPGPPLRAGPAAEHLDAIRPVHAREAARRPGMLDRPGAWWPDRLYDPESERGGAHPLHAVVTEDGYALYAVKPEWGGRGEVVIRELIATTPEARARLWAFLLDQDLTEKATWDLAPADEALWLMLADGRALDRKLGDALWVRIVDVPAALAARAYATDSELVFELDDAFLPASSGRYRLAGGDCERTDAAADLALEAAALGAAYLGGTTFRELAEAGRVRELRPGAVAEATAAFRNELAPWCPEIF